MRKIKVNRYLLLSGIMLLIIWLMVGISKDDEFEEYAIFLKYRPSTQVYFKSPLGMQDMPPDYPPALKAEEAVYDEFINRKHWSDGPVFTSLAGMFLLLTPVMLVKGIRGQLRSRT